MFVTAMLLITSFFKILQDRIVPFVSSLYLHRLLHPGVYHNIVLRATFLDYSKQWTDNEFQLLTVDGLKNEILSLVEHEVFFASLFHFFAPLDFMSLGELVGF